MIQMILSITLVAIIFTGCVGTVVSNNLKKKSPLQHAKKDNL